MNHHRGVLSSDPIWWEVTPLGEPHIKNKTWKDILYGRHTTLNHPAMGYAFIENYIDTKLVWRFHQNWRKKPNQILILYFTALFKKKNTKLIPTRRRISIVRRRCRKPFNIIKCDCTFHWKASLPLARRLTILSDGCSDTDHKDFTGLSGFQILH